MNSKPSFKDQQVAFAAHIRSPETVAKPDGIEDRRMAIYRDLFINSISGLLSGSFPVIRSLYDEAGWIRLVRQFFRKEHNKTPHFPEIPREFVDFLQHQPSDPLRPFLYELAHYEWLELHLEKHPLEITRRDGLTEESLLTAQPVISPLVRLRAYQYPVHKIKQDFQPVEALEQPVFLTVWRDLKEDVHFAELNPFSALLLEHLINNQSMSGREILETLACQHQHPDSQQFVGFGAQTMLQWYQQHILTDITPT
ncbi:DUF2063 domain-containing protein [Marinicella sediminis]|uniref:DUF2063 domain-containing protein n=1 Tax=Marinicella sediminis TaxID=1792834 RepID=A0ABV7JCE4_9GAMM|nr:putative DNA-binding domain-containing protein [Marinicella sediminis]